MSQFYYLSLHDALPIYWVISPTRGDLNDCSHRRLGSAPNETWMDPKLRRTLGPCVNSEGCPGDRKSTRLNSSHVAISYAAFSMKKKNTQRSRLKILACR